MSYIFLRMNYYFAWPSLLLFFFLKKDILSFNQFCRVPVVDNAETAANGNYRRL
jgi:hypothetical protein